MRYAQNITLDLSYDVAVPKVKEVFRTQGFGTLTEIDVQTTLQEKLGVHVERYVILGACNPHLAYRALEASRAEAGERIKAAIDTLLSGE